MEDLPAAAAPAPPRAEPIVCALMELASAEDEPGYRAIRPPAMPVLLLPLFAMLLLLLPPTRLPTPALALAAFVVVLLPLPKVCDADRCEALGTVMGPPREYALSKPSPVVGVEDDDWGFFEAAGTTEEAEGEKAEGAMEIGAEGGGGGPGAIVAKRAKAPDGATVRLGFM